MMLSASVRLLRLFLSRDKKAAVFSMLGIAIGVGALLFFVGLGQGIGRVVREKVFPVDARLVDVVPSSVSLGGLWGSGKMDEAAVERLSRLHQVERVFRKMSVRVPSVTRYDGNFFGSRLRMGAEVLALGVEADWFSDVFATDAFTDKGADAAIPAVVSSRLIEIYNKGFAPSRKLPHLSGKMLEGFVFPVEFNRSFVAAAADGASAPSAVQVLGTSDRALLAGITIPLETARRLNRQFGVDWETYSSVTLRAISPQDVPALVKAVKDMGFEVDDEERRIADNAGLAVAVVTSAFSLLSLMICVLSAVNIAHALMAALRARQREIGIMRAVGATQADIRRLVLMEGGLLGLLGGVLGSMSAAATAWIVDRVAGSLLPPFPFQPESFFWFPIWLWPLGGVLGLMAAMAGAYGPARHASSQEPARVLAG